MSFDPLPLGRRAQAMIDALAAISEEHGRITRHFLTPEHRRAIDLVADWMRAAGLKVTLHSTGTVSGALAAGRVGPLAGKTLYVGSHIDSVVDAGRYDGTLGVIGAILAVDELRARGMALPFGLEVFAFGDEEGVRFPKAMLGSSALAGAVDPGALECVDPGGLSLRKALISFGLDPDRIAHEGHKSDQAIGYLELHIEQGPVLEANGVPLGVVTAIAGQSRFAVRVTGEAGHAGTVPMALRKDALAATADLMMRIERLARQGTSGLVATVGKISAGPGAVNVIPGEVEFTLDLRAGLDSVRHEAIDAMRATCHEVAAERQVSIAVEDLHELPVVAAAPWLQDAATAAIRDLTGHEPPRLMSGAGHDGQAMARLTGIGMIFVRCRGGISHNPAEFVSLDDLGIAVEALTRTIVAIAAAKDVGAA